jgi:uncharacterized protein (TIGR00369 family)
MFERPLLHSRLVNAARRSEFPLQQDWGETAQMSDKDAQAREPVSDEALLARFQNAKSQPPGSRTLGFRMLRLNQAERWVEIEFTGSPEFCNPMGQIQGGYVCAMLDEAMSVAGVVTSGMTVFMPTLEMKTSFLRPTYPGKLRCVGKVLQWGKSIAFTEGELYGEDGKLLAKATATAKPTPFKRPDKAAS